MKFSINGLMHEAGINLFPAGELGVYIKGDLPVVPYNLTIYYEWGKYTNNGLIVVAQLLDAVSRYYNYVPFSKELVLKYVPYSRQDRVCNPGESHSLKVFTSIINDMDFDKVITWDNHSDIATALINNCTHIPQEEFFKDYELQKNHNFNDGSTVLVSPDMGASKKTSELAKQLDASYFIQCDKKRNIKTGKIESIEALNYQYLHGDKSEFFVVDDLCDGGGTFLGLAKAIRETNPKAVLYLYVTHGFFTQGLTSLLREYSHIYTTNSVCSLVHPNLTILGEPSV